MVESQFEQLEISVVDQAEVDNVSPFAVARMTRPRKRRPSSIFWMTPFACTSSKWAKCPAHTRTGGGISKRIEDAENEVKRIIYSFGFTGKEHIALAEKLISEPPKERFDRVIVDKKIDSREQHLKVLPSCKDVRAVDHKVDEKYMSRLKAKNQAARTRAEKASIKTTPSCRSRFRNFLQAKGHRGNVRRGRERERENRRQHRGCGSASKGRKTAANKQIIEGETRKMQALEIFTR